jgi:hypothetical protein
MSEHEGPPDIDEEVFVDRRTLAERRADHSGLTGPDGLRATVNDLALEVHKLRGTLQFYAPRTEMARDLKNKIDELYEQLAKDRKALVRQRANQLRLWAASLLIIIGALALALFSVAGFNRADIEDLQVRVEELEDP